MDKSTIFRNIRIFAFGQLGLVAFAVLAVSFASRNVDAVPWWVSGASGVITAVVMFAGSLIIGSPIVDREMDEHYHQTEARSYKFAFWATAFSFPITGFLTAFDVASINLAYLLVAMTLVSSFFLSLTYQLIRQ